ncbi:hypothetical protein Nepgr_030166 [Nepenthes gracilis]|uniref:Transmembrane protein n=1 Tax=Nepenthes gracilis TaxID=150966 RepID=A0AAD3TE03_NEPGR|nr:hypothetical protein Nepgr_030166 [Nepenthes gracilis]
MATWPISRHVSRAVRVICFWQRRRRDGVKLRHPSSLKIKRTKKMPHRTRPMTALLLFTGLNAILVSTISPVYDFVCFLPYWERRRERRRLELDASRGKGSNLT